MAFVIASYVFGNCYRFRARSLKSLFIWLWEVETDATWQQCCDFRRSDAYLAKVAPQATDVKWGVDRRQISQHSKGFHGRFEAKGAEFLRRTRTIGCLFVLGGLENI
jgi:hypothetical protein